MIQVASREEIKAYYEDPSLGQSKLKKLLGDLSNFNKEEDSNKEHFVIGSAVDCLLTGNPEDFKLDYYVSELEKTPSDAVIKIIKQVHEMVLQDYAEYLEVTQPVRFDGDHFVVEPQSLEPVEISSLEDFAGDLINHATYILEACENEEYQPNYKPDTKVNAIVKGGSKDETMLGDLYFKDLCRAFGKKVIDATQHQTILSITESLKNNPRTRRFFDREAIADLGNVEFYYQFPIYFEYRGIKCKCLLDIVVVLRDLDGKILNVQGIDLKTMDGNTYNFVYSLKQRRYDIQAAWYTLGLIDYFALSENPSVVAPFIFVVESTTYIGKPLAYVVNSELLDLGRYGRKAIHLIDTNMFDSNPETGGSALIQKEILGYEQLLDKYIYHNENGWSAEKEILEQDPETPLLLSWDGILSDLIVN